MTGVFAGTESDVCPFAVSEFETEVVTPVVVSEVGAIGEVLPVVEPALPIALNSSSSCCASCTNAVTSALPPEASVVPAATPGFCLTVAVPGSGGNGPFKAFMSACAAAA